MRLDQRELELIRSYLERGQPRVPDGLLAKVEVGVWVFPSAEQVLTRVLGRPVRIADVQQPPFLIVGTFGSSGTQSFLDAFRQRVLPYLMVRVESWEVFIKCNGEIMSEHCDEDLDAIRDACERLRQRCARGTPSVNP